MFDNADANDYVDNYDANDLWWWDFSANLGLPNVKNNCQINTALN